jgi:hypothetical protein
MIQPGLATTMLGDPELADQGLLSRCLVSAPESHVGRRFYRELAPETNSRLQAHELCLGNILRRPFPLAMNTRNVLAPPALRLTPKATNLWRGFADDVEKDLRPGGGLLPVSGFANKMPEHAARLAAVLTLVENPAAAELTADVMARGVLLARYYASEALRLFQGSKIDRDLRVATQLLEWLLNSWSEPNISLPDIYQTGPNAIRDRKTALRLVGILVQHGHLLKLPETTIVRGKRRREAWRIVSEGSS